MIRSLTKDDLRVEADGWVAVLKEQAGRERPQQDRSH
jgi:hypothetical protein